MIKKPKYKICIAGAIEPNRVPLDTLDKAKRIGRKIAKSGHFVVTGAHHGFPMFASMGARAAGGDVIYFSPAGNKSEHIDAYRLDTNHSDIIIYTGFGHTGANMFMSKSADAVILGLGKLHGVHEFVLALQAGKPVGVLKGDWETDEVVNRFAKSGKHSHIPIVFEEDPEQLVLKLLELIK